MQHLFKAVVVRESEGSVSTAFEDLEMEMLPPGDLTLRVECSTLNYKDGMVMKGLGRLVRNYPHVPGVDLVGEVVQSSNPKFSNGDMVIVTGFRMGELYWGGFSQFARVSSEWAVALPKGLSAARAMAIGTAGLTSMLAVMALEEHGLVPTEAPVLVTGAAGGVGSTAVALLKALGYSVAASTGRSEESEYLRRLGANTIVKREALAEATNRPLESEQWSGCIDAVGGSTLARVLGQMKSNSSIASVGLAGGANFSANVMPFLLRGVNILGIDSVMAPIERRIVAWDRLTRQLPLDILDSMTTHATLEEVPDLAEPILAGKVRGRVVVQCW